MLREPPMIGDVIIVCYPEPDRPAHRATVRYLHDHERFGCDLEWISPEGIPMVSRGDRMTDRPDCEACQAYPAGMLLYPLTPNSELMGVQRCDTCGVYREDFEAGEMYLKIRGLPSDQLHVAVGAYRDNTKVV